MDKEKKILTKADIEKMAIFIADYLEANGYASDVSIYFNNKCIEFESGEFDEDNEKVVVPGKRNLIENIVPEFKYFAKKHILSMIYLSNPLFDQLYEQHCFPDPIQNMIDDAGLYFEFGDWYNLTLYPNSDDMEIEYTYYEEEEKPVQLYHYAQDNLPEFQEIMDYWYKASEATGCMGYAVLGAGFNFRYKGVRYFMNACSPWQGEFSWLPHVDNVKAMLENIGAEEISYEHGMID